MENIKERYRRFREWEKQPHEVAPLSEDEHVCATCGTHFEGNYCPRCGQSAKIGRYSFKKAFLLFLDVWGVGNRGMFRTLRDLILRPGYMIRDYLRGMQMAYFPPFKMFFLLFALSFLIDSGLNIQGVNRKEHEKEEATEIVQKLVGQDQEKDNQTETQETKEKTDKKLTAEEREKKEKRNKEFERLQKEFNEWSDSHVTYVMLILLLLFSLPLWLLIRHCPTIPDLRFSECFVAMVYIANMLTIYGLIPSFLCFSMKAELIYGLMTILLIIIPIKQLSGYSYWKTIWRMALATIPFLVMILLLVIGVFAAQYIYAIIKFG